MDNVFTQLMRAMLTVNQNIIDIYREVAQLRADITALKEMLVPLSEPVEGMELTRPAEEEQ